MLAPPAPWHAPHDGLCEGADWQRNHEAAGVDVATFQLWPDDWLLAPEPWKLQWSRRWVRPWLPKHRYRNSDAFGIYNAFSGRQAR